MARSRELLGFIVGPARTEIPGQLGVAGDKVVERGWMHWRCHPDARPPDMVGFNAGVHIKCNTLQWRRKSCVVKSVLAAVRGGRHHTSPPKPIWSSIQYWVSSSCPNTLLLRPKLPRFPFQHPPFIRRFMWKVHSLRFTIITFHPPGHPWTPCISKSVMTSSKISLTMDAFSFESAHSTIPCTLHCSHGPSVEMMPVHSVAAMQYCSTTIL